MAFSDVYLRSDRTWAADLMSPWLQFACWWRVNVIRRYEMTLAKPSGPAQIHFSVLVSPRSGFLFVLSLITNETVKYVPKDAFHRLLEYCLPVHRMELWSQCILHCKKASILLQLTTALARRVCGCKREWSRQFSRDIYRVSLHELCKDRTYEAFGVLSPQWGLLWEKKNWHKLPFSNDQRVWEGQRIFKTYEQTSYR